MSLSHYILTALLLSKHVLRLQLRLLKVYILTFIVDAKCLVIVYTIDDIKPAVVIAILQRITHGVLLPGQLDRPTGRLHRLLPGILRTRH